MGKPDWRADHEWERGRVEEILDGGFFRHPHVSITDVPTQKRGIDVWVMSPSGKKGVELKVVRYHSSVGAITIETHSNLERSGSPEGNGDGWINYSEADWLAWCFTDKAYLWKMPDLRVWWSLQDPRQWPVFDKDNGRYTTRVRKVPLSDIPLKRWERNYD